MSLDKKKFQNIMNLINELSEPQTIQLRARLDIHAKRFKRLSTDNELFYESFVQIAHQRRFATLPPWGIFKKRADFMTFDKKTNGLFLYLNQNCPGLSLPQKVAAYRFCAGMLLQHLRENRILISPKSIISSLDKIPALIDKGFPDYVENKMLKMLFTGEWLVNDKTGTEAR